MTNHVPWVPDKEPENYQTINHQVRQDPDTLTRYVTTLRQHPGRRLAWSHHRTRGAARQRITALRGSRLFAGFEDVRFETRSALPGDPEKGVYILVYVDEEY